MAFLSVTPFAAIVTGIALTEHRRTIKASCRTPHARIVRIGAAKARAMPGVLAVYTGADCLADGLRPFARNAVPSTKYDMKLTAPGGGQVFVGRHMLLPADKARYVGEAVAMVVAKSRDRRRLPDVAFFLHHGTPAILLQFVVSFGFILPVNSPQGMLAYGTQTFFVRDFVRTGIAITALAYLLTLIFGATYWHWLGYV
jgi:sodium:sulfate symporter-like transmembrane protein/aldehyde oxidase/xanthine dehydrogenase-like protein